MPKTSLAGKTTATVRQILTTGVSARVFADVEERAELKAKIATLQEDVKAIDVRLLRHADKHDGEIRTDDFTIKAIDATNRTLSKDMLLQLGVKPTVIAKATIETAYRYARVFAKGDKA